MNIGINAAFIKLKPLCDQITEDPTIEQLNELQKAIQDCSASSIQQLHEYIIFPLYVNLLNENKSYQSNLKQALVDTLACVLRIIKLNKIKLFLQLCISITKQVFDSRTSSIHSFADEEFKLSTINCLNIIFKQLSLDNLTELYTKTNSFYFPQCIFLCLQIAQNEKMRELRLCAIECLMTIFYVHDDADNSDIVLRKQVADATLFFLPGVTKALRNVAIDDDKQGHKITSLAIKAIKRIILLHMQDEIKLNEDEIIFKLSAVELTSNIVEKTEDNRKSDEIIKRFQTETKSPEWIEKTGNNLKKMIETLMPLQSHYHEKVRLELGKFCREILFSCPRNLENCLSYCLEILIALSEDENDEVSTYCSAVLNSTSQYCSNIVLMEILSENFFNLVTKLPRIIYATDVQQQLSVLNLFVGYLRSLKTNLITILQSAEQLKRLINSLIIISQLEKINITLFEEYAIRDFESISINLTSWKHFKYIEDKSLFLKVQTALTLLSESNANEIIIDYLCDIFTNDYEHKNEVVFLINEIISVKVEDMETRFHSINNILKLYTEEENWHLSTDNTELNLTEMQTNIVQMCLLVEGLGNMSEALGVKYKTFLLKTLYIILERAGSAQPLLSIAGLSTLLKISKACDYDSVTDLIVKNTDYFSFHVTKRLKRFELNTGVLNVLNVVMKYSTIDVLPSITNIINEVLLYSCDKFHEHNLTAFLSVFCSFVQNLKRWFEIHSTDENKIITILKEYKKNMDFLHAMYGEIINFQDDIMSQSADEMFKEDLEKSKDEIDEELNVDDNSDKPEVPENIQLTVAVLKRSLNFLPNKDRDRKILVLSILKDGIEIINRWEDELLPIVHLIWSPFVDRFTEINDSLIINKSFDLLCILAKYSKDFIRSRTSKEVLPQICSVLKTLSEKSYLKDKGSAYRYTQDYKLQLSLLNGLPQLVNDLDMSVDDLDQILKAILPYLSRKQPLPLQETVIVCYKSLAMVNFESVWLVLLDIWGTTPDHNTDFRRNTENLLKTLEVLHW